MKLVILTVLSVVSQRYRDAIYNQVGDLSISRMNDIHTLSTWYKGNSEAKMYRNLRINVASLLYGARRFS